ncbi:Hsp33 family molecular chaperone HslO [Alkalibacter mobilis]|uniref:Hsp33 family molecular chaperone HslO n=1 Tax=Alkalibacter mobilis TaxID=2787712 RepID=UPI00189CF3F0|nr:Hsp33 family molecular chaperone HslO [Alkalibacter mobilis]MBF7097739.1 Hsp33 family molecular chaperone HslO [Alkalibacter mobilis]
MKDQITSFKVEGIQARVFAVNSKESVREMQRIHNASYTATAAAGRALSATAMMIMTLKNETDRINAQIKCDGPIKGIVVAANANGEVKVDIYQPMIYIPLKKSGKLDVASAIGKGTLTIVKDLGLKNPYTGNVNIVSGEIAEDFTYYFAASEQTPSVVALGVLIDKNDTVIASGGYMIQLLPDCPEETISYIEKRISEIDSVTAMMEKGMNQLQMVEYIFENRRVEILATKDLNYKCDCSRDRIEKGISMLKKDDLKKMISEDKGAEVTCHFCNSKYEFSEEELQKIYDKIK